MDRTNGEGARGGSIERGSQETLAVEKGVARVDAWNAQAILPFKTIVAAAAMAAFDDRNFICFAVLDAP